MAKPAFSNMATVPLYLKPDGERRPSGLGWTG